jgi:hypothetical protein
MQNGCLEKAMLPGAAFTLGPEDWRPALGDLRLVAGVATYGGARWRNWLAGDSARKMATRAVWSCTGWRAAVRDRALYGVDKARPERRETFRGQTPAAMDALARRG